MSARKAVRGQTGKTVLSTEQLQYKFSLNRVARFWFVKCAHGYRAQVVVPFHSALYGVCGFGTKRHSAKAALRRNLANNYGYIGRMILTDFDDANNVGRVDKRLLDGNATARPITFHKARAGAGM